MMLIAVLPVLAFGASRSVDGMGESQYADTEISTNIVFQVDAENFNRLEFSLQLEASSSNALEVAIGREGDFDGRLSLDETDLAFGCDMGEWFLRSTADESFEKLSEALAAGPVVHTLVLRREDMDAGWNLIRITRRGAGTTSESVSVRNFAVGLRIIVK